MHYSDSAFTFSRLQSPESLQKDVVLSCLRSSMPVIREGLLGTGKQAGEFYLRYSLSIFHSFHPKALSPSNSGTSDGTEILTVASLSASFGKLCKFHICCTAYVTHDRSAAVVRTSDSERVSDGMTTTQSPPLHREKMVDHSDDIDIDGYISQMFGPEGATAYFAGLLQVDPRTLRSQVVTGQEWLSMFFICNPLMPLARPFVTIRGQPVWLLDSRIKSFGTVIQQRIWAPQNEAQRHAHAPLNLPIFFALNDGVTLGLPIVTAAARDIITLHGARTPAPVGECSTTFIRINVSAICPLHSILWRVRALPVRLSSLQSQCSPNTL